MRKDFEDETWEADAQASFAVAAESEFSRLKQDLKRKAGLLPTPWYIRVLHRLKRLFS